MPETSGCKWVIGFRTPAGPCKTRTRQACATAHTPSSNFRWKPIVRSAEKLVGESEKREIADQTSCFDCALRPAASPIQVPRHTCAFPAPKLGLDGTSQSSYAALSCPSGWQPFGACATHLARDPVERVRVAHMGTVLLLGLVPQDGVHVRDRVQAAPRAAVVCQAHLGHLHQPQRLVHVALGHRATEPQPRQRLQGAQSGTCKRARGEANMSRPAETEQQEPVAVCLRTSTDTKRHNRQA